MVNAEDKTDGWLMTDQLFINLLGPLLPWVLVAGFVSILTAFFRFFLLPIFKGRRGEARVNSRILSRLDPSVYHLIPDMMLPVANGTTQIDHIIVSRYGIFVLETKNYTGWIFGGAKQAKWTQVIYKKKSYFQNPLHQNYRHVKALCELTGLPEKYFISLAVFAGDCTFKTDMPENVVYVRDVVNRIRSFTRQIIPDEIVTEIISAIQQRAATVTTEQKSMHVANLRRSHQASPTHSRR